MAFVVETRRGTFEIRESRSTPKGPRSRTLASFTEFNDEIIEKARAKAAGTLSAVDLRKAARRAGAPIGQKPVDRAARELIAELARGRRPEPALRHMLIDLLRHGFREGPDPSPANEAGRAVAEWMAATPRERGKALVDLLLFADALPVSGRKDKPLCFPRLDLTADD